MDSKSLVRVSGGITVLLTEYKDDELFKFSNFPSLSHWTEQSGEHSTRHEIFMFVALTRAPWYGGSLSMNVGGAGRKNENSVNHL